MTPSITIAIPFYNEATHLGMAVRSVLAQTITDFELLLVDDGSTDASIEIARSFERDSRVSVLTDGRRRHLPARLNEIVRRARAPFIARMDADDLSHPDRLARELELLSRSSDVSAVGTWIALIDGDELICVTESGMSAPTRKSALNTGILAHATMLARREWLLANPYNEALTRAEDRDLWCRTVSTTRFAVVPDVLYVARVDSGSADFVARYAESQRQNRALFREYGPATYGWKETARATAYSFAKTAAIRAAVQLGAAPRLVRRRGRAPTADERAKVVATIAAAQRE